MDEGGTEFSLTEPLHVFLNPPVELAVYGEWCSRASLSYDDRHPCFPVEHLVVPSQCAQVVCS